MIESPKQLTNPRQSTGRDHLTPAMVAERIQAQVLEAVTSARAVEIRRLHDLSPYSVTRFGMSSYTS